MAMSCSFLLPPTSLFVSFFPNPRHPLRCWSLYCSFFCFNWSVIYLQCCISFCCKQHESVICIDIAPPSGTSKSSQSTELSSLCHTAASHQLSILYMVNICVNMFARIYTTQWCMYVNATPLIRLPLFFPLWVHTSVLCPRVSIPALQIGQSVPFFQISQNYHQSESVSRSFHRLTPWTVACQAPLSMEFSR